MARIPQQRFFFRRGALVGIDRVLAELGVEPEPLLAEHGLSCDMLSDGDRLVTVEQATALLAHAARETDCPHFTMELASRQDVNLLGAIGLLLQTADTVREALQDVERYLRTTHVSHMHWTLVKHGEFDAFELTTELPDLTSQQARMVLELGVAQCYRILKSVSGGGLKLASICFRHGDLQNLPVLKRFFACDKRTLQRCLREDYDTTYHQLLDEVRFETACYYLRESPREWRRSHGKDTRGRRMNRRAIK